jgi:vancomycin resistance protein YoaR
MTRTRAMVQRLHRHWAIAGLAVATIVLGGVYVGLAIFLAGHVPSDTTVDGVAIGGMSPREASVTLKRGLDTKAARPVHLTTGSRTVDITPATAGLQLDVGATVADLTSFTVNPLQMWAHVTGTANQPVTLRVDRGKLTTAVTQAAGRLDHRVKEGSIAFTGGRATTVLPLAGTTVKVPETTDAVAAAWPHRQVVQAVTKMTAAKVSAQEVGRAAKEFALPAMSAPVTVVVGSRTAATVILAPRQFAPALSTYLDGTGRLRLRIAMPTVMTAIREAAPRIEHPPVDATVRFAAGRPQVVPATAGMRFDDGPAASARFRLALTSRARTVTMRLVPVAPKVTTAAALGWHIAAAISTFTTQFPVNPPRTNNIKAAVATLNGTVVRPGAQFSLNATLGERTAAKGYRRAPVIYAGRLVSDYGGGVSQVSTTTFNAAFFAGVRIDQHTPHSFYIARYPEGREATVSWPDVDQKWTNDTGSGILIQASVEGNNLSVTLWGTKKWDIEAVKGPRRNQVKPKTIVDAKAGCVAQLPTPGFDVTVTQIFKRNGAQVRTVVFNTHYIPEDTVTCTHPVAP